MNKYHLEKKEEKNTIYLNIINLRRRPMLFCSVNIPSVVYSIPSVPVLGINAGSNTDRPADPQFTDQLLDSGGLSQEELLGLVSKRSGDFNGVLSQELEQGQEET